MGHVDALSRAINILHVVDESFEFVMAAMQKQDPKITAIASELEKAESADYEMIDGLIYKKIKDKVLFFVPEQMEIQVIRTHHDALGHLGVDKLYEFLCRSYWFPSMKKKIREYAKNCLKCIYFSPDSGKAQGELHNIPKGNSPFDTLHIDHLGPLSDSKTKKHIFLIVDAFTKFVKLYAVKSTQSKEAINCLKSYFENYSRPVRIVSDRGTCFSSKEFSDFIESNNVQHVKVASHCPQGNGQVERVNRVLVPMLAKYCESGSTSDWYKHLVKIEYALNNTINRSTGFTPAMLLFGTNQRGELCDKVIEHFERNSVIDHETRQEIRNMAYKNMEKSQDYNKRYFDKKHKVPIVYKKGDYVMIRNFTSLHGVNKKLFSKFRGPYEVEKVLSHDRYVVKDIEGMQLKRVPFKGVCAPQNMRPFMINLDDA